MSAAVLCCSLQVCGGSLEQAIAHLSSSVGDRASSTGSGVITQETGGVDPLQQGAGEHPS